MTASDCSPRANGHPGAFRGFLPAGVAADLAECSASGGAVRTFADTATPARGDGRTFGELLFSALVVSILVSVLRG